MQPPPPPSDLPPGPASPHPDPQADPQAADPQMGLQLRRALSWQQQLGLWALIILCVLMEALPFAADQGWIGSSQWRSTLLQNGAFWTGLLHNWRPNYALQPWVMFVTYGFLHADPWHLIGNMLVLYLFGRLVLARIGQGWFLVLYVLSMLGGALGFAYLAPSAQPMVGASGALFGLIGAWQLWHWQSLAGRGDSRWPVIRMALWLVLINLVMGVLQPGGVAWQAHLGGYGAGVFAGFLYSLLHRQPPTG